MSGTAARKDAVARALLDARSLAGWTGYRKFVAVGTARTGSTLLMGLLNAHSQALAFGELFRTPDAVGWDVAPFTTFQSAPLLASYRADPLAFLGKYVFRRWPRATKAVGFKLFYYHAREAPRDALWTYLRDAKNVSILHIKRANILAQYLSLRLAHMTDVWSASRLATREAEPVRLEVEACRKHFAWVRGMERDCDEFFKNHDVHNVEYDDLVGCRDRVMHDVESFLGLGHERLSARTVRQETRSPREAIANYDELERAFSDTEWAPFFRDQTA